MVHQTTKLNPQKNMKLQNFYIFILLLISGILNAQEDTDDLLNVFFSDEPAYATSVFKASRIMNTHSIKQPNKGEMEFRISHRFGKINGGSYELWGLDQATIHFSLEYNPIERLTVGLGRSNYKKTYDGFAKYSIFKQQTGKRNTPLFLTYFGSTEISSTKTEVPDFKGEHRMRFTHQLLIARKFSKRLSIQITPTLIHKNLVETPDMHNNIMAIGFGGRYKITKRLSFNWDTYWVDHGPMPEGISYFMPLTIGVDLETGGHVFQILLSNSLPMREAGFITETMGEWGKGDIHLGFNISRMFHLHK